jgi:CO/xanthine dehydrogenase FAD-binding subunit
MKPPSFEYAAPATVAEAVALLQRYDGEAMVLAGGQSLMPLLNMRFARPAALIDLNRIAGLDTIREEAGQIVLGAMVTKRQVERSELVATRQPLLHAATRWIAHPQIRNRGTVGGSMAQADPAAEYPAVAVALGAELCVTGPEGERRIAAADFFVTYLTTDLAEHELLTEIRVPVLPERTGWAIQEVARRHGDFAMVGAVVTLALDPSGRCGDARVVLFGVGPVPLRATAAEAVLRGQAPDRALFEAAATAAEGQVEEPIADVHASAEYRRHLAAVLTRRSLEEAAGRAG